MNPGAPASSLDRETGHATHKPASLREFVEAHDESQQPTFSTTVNRLVPTLRPVFMTLLALGFVLLLSLTLSYLAWVFQGGAGGR